MTLGDVGKNILMIFVPIWPKNDIRLEEHDFSNILPYHNKTEQARIVVGDRDPSMFQNLQIQRGKLDRRKGVIPKKFCSLEYFNSRPNKFSFHKI